MFSSEWELLKFKYRDKMHGSPGKMYYETGNAGTTSETKCRYLGDYFYVGASRCGESCPFNKGINRVEQYTLCLLHKPDVKKKEFNV